MNASKLFVVFASILALVFASGFASADGLTLTRISAPSSVANNAGSFIAVYDVSYTGTSATTDVDFSTSGVSMSNGATATINIPAITGLQNNNIAVQVIANITFPNAPAGTTITPIVRADPSSAGETLTDTFTVQVTSSTLTISTPALIFIGSNATLTLQNNGIANLLGVALSATSATNGLSFSFNPATISLIAANGGQATTSVRATGNDLRFGSYTATVHAEDSARTSAVNNDVTVVKSFCTAGPVGVNLTITKLKISSDGDKDEEWKPLDNVEVEVKVKNIGGNDVDNVIVELGLFDSTGDNVVTDLEFSNTDEEQIDLGDLNDGDDDTATFEFTVPADFDISATSYKLAVKAYSDGDENKMCIDNDVDEFDNTYFESISIDQESDKDKFIAIDNVQLPSEIVCGESVTGSFEAFNIGEKDQDQVLIRMTNSNLGLNQQFEIRNNMDIGDSAVIDFSFVVPGTTRDGLYPLSFRSSYDYRNGNYRHDSDETSSPASLKVIGCSGTITPAIGLVIEEELDSDPLPGETLVVSATFKNSGTESIDLTLDASGYQSWAELDDISDDSFTLAAGQSKSVTYTFSINEDAAGAKSFTIEARSADAVETQEVEVPLPEARKKFSLNFNNPILWVVGAINVILIVLIIVVAVRLARK